MCNSPAAAVLLATYNGGRYIEELLQSPADQTYSNFKCYIHDDGSKDNTVDICRKFADSYPEKFIILDYPPTGGAKNNFFRLCQGLMRNIYCSATRMMSGQRIKFRKVSRR